MPEIGSSSPRAGSPSVRWRKWAEPLIGLVLLGVAAWVLHSELEQVEYQDIVAALRALPLRAELAALGFMAVNYLVLTGFDLLAFVYIGKRIAVWRVMAASFVAYSISNNVGFTLLSGTSARYRFYSRWGLSPGDLSRVVLFYTSTYWVGLLLLGGWVLAFHPHPALGEGGQVVLLRAVGGVLLLLAIVYAVAPFVRSAPIRIRQFVIPIPPPRLVLGQFLLSAADWVLAASIFYSLMPPDGPGFGQVLGAFLAAQVLAQISHVPGGLGVFEGSMLLLLGAQVPTEQLLGSLILFRIVYYLIPLAIALLVLLGDEVRQRSKQAQGSGGAFGSLASEVAPKLLAVFLFLSGAALLFSGVRPVDPGRMAWLLELVPLAAAESAHVAASVVGAALLVVSHGIGRRLHRAYPLAVGLLVAGMAASLLRAGEFEEALFLGAVLAVLAATRDHFDRSRPFWNARFGGGWLLATAAVLAASVWMGVLAYRHTGLPADLWWHFDASADAARFLRGSAGAALTLLVLSAARLFRARGPDLRPATRDERARAAHLLAASGRAGASHVPGRALLWSRDRDAFLSYDVRGRRWIAFGDPVGPAERHAALVRSFVERADDFNGQPLFVGIAADRLDVYRDFGLTCAPLDAEARALLNGGFQLDGDRFLAYPGGLPFAGVMADVLAAARDPEVIDLRS